MCRLCCLLLCSNSGLQRRRKRRWRSCSLFRQGSVRRRNGPDSGSSLAPLPRRGGGRGRRGGSGVFLAPPLGFRGAENCGVSAVAVLQHCCRLLLSCRKRRSLWSSLFSRPQSFLICSTFQAGFAGYNTPRAVFSFLVRRPMKLCIMAGMVQKDSCSGMARLVLMVTVHLVLCSPLCLQAQDARLHGRHGPQDSLEFTGAFLGQGFLHARRCATCGVLDQDSAVLAVPQLQFITVVVTPCCFAEADPHGPGCSDDH